MLFILALQHQRNYNSLKENQHEPSEIFKEAIRYQSIILRESLLKEVKRLKRQAKRQESLNYYENENYWNIIDDDEENNNFHIEEINHHRHRHHTLNHHKSHKRCKSKGINHFNSLEESKINNEHLNNNEIKICPICLDNYNIGDKIVYLPCFHLYHSKCIKKWLKCSKNCPLCKKDINVKNNNI